MAPWNVGTIRIPSTVTPDPDEGPDWSVTSLASNVPAHNAGAVIVAVLAHYRNQNTNLAAPAPTLSDVTVSAGALTGTTWVRKYQLAVQDLNWVITTNRRWHVYRLEVWWARATQAGFGTIATSDSGNVIGNVILLQDHIATPSGDPFTGYSDTVVDSATASVSIPSITVAARAMAVAHVHGMDVNPAAGTGDFEATGWAASGVSPLHEFLLYGFTNTSDMGGATAVGFRGAGATGAFTASYPRVADKHQGLAFGLELA